MEQKGIIRRVDELGRIVLPREMRKMLNVRIGTKLEIGIVDGKRIYLRDIADAAAVSGETR